MKKNLTVGSNFFKLVLILMVLVSLHQKKSSAQTIIFKTDGSQVFVDQIDTLKRVITYTLANQTSSDTYYISRSVIDSIRFENGTRIFDTPPVMLPGTREKAERIKRNFIGINFWPFLAGRVNAFYEILLWKDNLGFKNSFTYEKYRNYENQNFEDFSVTSGLNYYFLQSEYFRFGTGIALELGKKDEYDYDSFYANENYSNGYTRPPIIKTPYRFFYFNASFSYIFKKTLYSTIEVSLPVILKRVYNEPTIFKTEFAINF